LFPFHSLSKLILSLVGLSSWPVGDRKRVRKRRWINYVSGTGIKPRKAKTDFGLGSEEKTFWYWQTRSRRDNPEDVRTTQQEKNCGIADKYRAIENCPDFAKVIWKHEAKKVALCLEAEGRHFEYLL
jgi:hypothetical protein